MGAIFMKFGRAPATKITSFMGAPVYPSSRWTARAYARKGSQPRSQRRSGLEEPAREPPVRCEAPDIPLPMLVHQPRLQEPGPLRSAQPGLQVRRPVRCVHVVGDGLLIAVEPFNRLVPPVPQRRADGPVREL